HTSQAQWAHAQENFLWRGRGVGGHVLLETFAHHDTSYVVEFSKSSIGYAKDDCAIRLCSSSTGVRFLALAAALLCTAVTFTVSQALEPMIISSAGRGQILPTTTQLRDLLAALEHKLNRTGLAQNVLGWETFLTGHPELPD